MPKKPKNRPKEDVGALYRLFELGAKVKSPWGIAGICAIGLSVLLIKILSLNIYEKIGPEGTQVFLQYLVSSVFWAFITVILAFVIKVVWTGKQSAQVNQAITDLDSSFPKSSGNGEPREAGKAASAKGNQVVNIGICSFTTGTEEWEYEMNARLQLTEFFEGRKIKNSKSWQKDLFPRIQAFLQRPCKTDQECHLHFRAHTSIAFAAGYCLPTRTGLTVFPVQYTPAPVLWRPNGSAVDCTYARWSVNVQAISQETKKKKSSVDVAIGIGVAQDPCKDVRDFVAKSLPTVGRIIYFVIESAPSNQAIADGVHAKLLVDHVSNVLKTERTTDERQGTLHIFAAAPHGFMFLLGQLAHSFGPCVIYEYDLERNTPGGYEPSMAFPPK